MIQSFHRFLMDCVIQEGNAFPDNPWVIPIPVDPSDPESTSPPAPSPITQLLGLDAKNIVVCTNCKATKEKENLTHMIDLVYPRKVGLRYELCEFSVEVTFRHSHLAMIPPMAPTFPPSSATRYFGTRHTSPTVNSARKRTQSSNQNARLRLRIFRPSWL